MFTIEQLFYLKDVLEAAEDSFKTNFPVKMDEFDQIMIDQAGMPVFQDPDHSYQFKCNFECLAKVDEAIEEHDRNTRNFQQKLEDLKGSSSNKSHISNWQKQVTAAVNKHRNVIVAVDNSEASLENFRELCHSLFGAGKPVEKDEIKCDCGGHKVKVPCRHWCSTQEK